MTSVRDAVYAVLLRHGYDLPGIADLAAGSALNVLREPSEALSEVISNAVYDDLGHPADWPGIDAKKVMAAVADALMGGE